MILKLSRLTLEEIRQNIIKIDNLSVSYGAILALKKVNLEVKEGEFVSLIGANGAGKSTLISSLVGLIRATSGSIWFQGENISGKSSDYIVASGISVIPEGRHVFPLMTVRENLLLGTYHIKGDLTKQFESVFNRFPILSERINQIAGTLSGGEQQMLAIGRGLMGEPKLLVLDEPSLGLAPIVVSEIFQMLGELNNEGQTILLSEQNARKAMQYSHRTYVFETGKVILEGPAKEIADNPRIREAYLGITL
jgi:branched-chain amino acid transport system ATP-binding protein